jgi:hypothetical protein
MAKRRGYRSGRSLPLGWGPNILRTTSVLVLSQIPEHSTMEFRRTFDSPGSEVQRPYEWLPLKEQCDFRRSTKTTATDTSFLNLFESRTF